MLNLSRRQLLAAFAPKRRVQIISHRGEHLDCPENTVVAIKRAIDLGCDWVELDVRTTRDGHFVLMHNATVEATTNGSGAVAALTLEQVRALDAGARKPKYRGTVVPTLDEALAALRGRCGIYLDAKQIPASAIVDHLSRHRMLGHAVVYGKAELLKELAALGHHRLTMPEANTPAALHQSLHDLNPRVVAFDRHDFEPNTIAVARAAHKEVFVDRLGEDDTADHWAAAIRLGATGIQTDHPAELKSFLATSSRADGGKK